MIPVLSQATLLPHSLATDLDACIKGGIRSVEIWLTKAEDHLKYHPLECLAKMFGDAGIRLEAASYQGGLLGGDPEARKAHLEHFRRRLDLCQALGIKTMGILPELVPGGKKSPTERLTPADMALTVDHLGQAADWAEAYGVHLALSFRLESPLPNNLQTALALVESAGRSNLGVALDCFPFFNGPSKTEDLAWVTPENLRLVRICDMSGGVRELARETETVLPGDGDWPLVSLVQNLRQKGYQGPLSVELMNPRLWQVKPSQLAELAWSSVLRLLGLKETA